MLDREDDAEWTMWVLCKAKLKLFPVSIPHIANSNSMKLLIL